MSLKKYKAYLEISNLKRFETKNIERLKDLISPTKRINICLFLEFQAFITNGKIRIKATSFLNPMHLKIYQVDSETCNFVSLKANFKRKILDFSFLKSINTLSLSR